MVLWVFLVDFLRFFEGFCVFFEVLWVFWYFFDVLWVFWCFFEALWVFWCFFSGFVGFLVSF